MLWTLNLSDGQHSLLNIAERSQMPFAVIKQVADRLVAQHLLKAVDD
jgi:aminopeptidase-like protein